MGRAGIRRRKLKQDLPPAEDPGILADLEDQAEWSSYGQDIPRLGNPRRQAIWWERGLRRLRNAGGRRNPMRHTGFWPAILVGVLGVAAFVLLAVLVVWILGRIL